MPREKEDLKRRMWGYSKKGVTIKETGKENWGRTLGKRGGKWTRKSTVKEEENGAKWQEEQYGTQEVGGN